MAGTRAAAAGFFLATAIFVVGADGALVVDELDELPDEHAVASRAMLAAAAAAAFLPMVGRMWVIAPPGMRSDLDQFGTAPARDARSQPIASDQCRAILPESGRSDRPGRNRNETTAPASATPAATKHATSRPEEKAWKTVVSMAGRTDAGAWPTT